MDALQLAARGAAADRATLVAAFGTIYRDLAVQAPGVTPDDLAAAVLAAVQTEHE